MHLSSPVLRDGALYPPGLGREHVSACYRVPREDVAKLGLAESPFGASPLAALEDVTHVERTVETICEMRAYVADRMRGLNAFRMVEGGRANFFLVEILNPDLSSTIVFEALLERGVIVKDCCVSVRGLGERYLRVDVSLQRHMDHFVSALEELDRD